MRILITVAIMLLGVSACNASDTPDLDNLQSKDLAVANTAALNLFKLRKYSIPKLLSIAESKESFRGNFALNPFWAFKNESESEAPTVGVVALYLIEAILREDLFFGYTAHLRLEGEYVDSSKEKEIQDRALILYRNWWEKNKDLESHSSMPLEGSNIRWTEVHKASEKKKQKRVSSNESVRGVRGQLLTLDVSSRGGQSGMMARKVRISYPDAICHVVARVNERARIFHDRADHELFLQCLGRAKRLVKIPATAPNSW